MPCTHLALTAVTSGQGLAILAGEVDDHHLTGQGMRTPNPAGYVISVNAADIVSSRLAGPAIGHELIGNLLTFVEAMHASALNGADVYKYVRSTSVRSNEAETLLRIEPLYRARDHISLSIFANRETRHQRNAAS